MSRLFKREVAARLYKEHSQMGRPVVHWELWSQNPESVKKIVAAGGTMVVETQEVPGMGSISLFRGPEGRMLGLWKAVR